MATIIKICDYSQFNSEKSCNGGGYGFWTEYSNLGNGKIEVSYGTTADFEFCPVCGGFSNHAAKDGEDSYESGYNCGEYEIITAEELVNRIYDFKEDEDHFIEVVR